MSDIQIRIAEAVVMGLMGKVEVTPIPIHHGNTYRATIHLTGMDCAEPGHPYCIGEDGESPAAAAGKLYSSLLKWYFDPTGDLSGAKVFRAKPIPNTASNQEARP